MGVKLQASQMTWCLPAFYLLGRELLLSYGLLRPQDAVEDIVYVMDFWKRFQLSWQRNNGHLSNAQAGHRAQILPDRTLEGFCADLFHCQPGDRLHQTAHAFMASASQYAFRPSSESRINLTNSGPHRVAAHPELPDRASPDMGSD